MIDAAVTFRNSRIYMNICYAPRRAGKLLSGSGIRCANYTVPILLLFTDNSRLGCIFTHPNKITLRLTLIYMLTRTKATCVTTFWDFSSCCFWRYCKPTRAYTLNHCFPSS
uniref:Uncharacterized protein n=1 Tax=Pararge aegeria TaxID=116150 RepID=S4NSI4_9NEOP